MCRIPSLVLVSLLLPTPPSLAQACFPGLCGFDTCHTPAYAQPAALWGELEPAAGPLVRLPALRDNTGFDQLSFFGCSKPFFEALDVENGWIFAVTNRGFQIWDARTSPANPVRVSEQCSDVAAQHPVPVFPSSGEDSRFTFRDVDAPAGHDGLVATALQVGSGVVIWDTASKTSPRVLYQDHGPGGGFKEAAQVWAGTLGSRHYAFAAIEELGLHVYDMSRAAELPATPCLENTPGELDPACQGVFLGRLGARTRAEYVDGHQDPGGEHRLVFSGGAGQNGLEVWDVSDPLAPRPLLADVSERLLGVAIWREPGGAFLLAVRALGESRIYRDGSGCLATGSTAVCSLADLDLLWSASLGHGGERRYVTWSESGGTPFLFFGSGEPCASRDRRERLYDVSDPANPREVGDADYWSFSYRPEETPLPTGTSAGFNHVAARMAKLSGDYLYRAAYGVFDVHRLRPSQGPAVAGVSASPASGTVCDAVELTATGLGGSPPLVYAWEMLDGAGEVVATAGNVNPFLWDPVAVPPAGSYRARVTVINALGTAEALSPPVPLTEPPPLRFLHPSAGPTADPPAGSTVRFHLEEEGASRWVWSFGDGTVEAFDDPEEGRHPVHTYPGPGFYPVQVTILNCRSLFGLPSAPLLVEIPSPGSLQVLEFEAQDCEFLSCTFRRGEVVTFTQSFAGDPDFFDYDWNGDGSFEETATAPVLTHAFPEEGLYVPIVRIRSGTEQAVRAHPVLIWIQGEGAPGEIFSDGFEGGDLLGWSVVVGESITRQRPHRVSPQGF